MGNNNSALKQKMNKAKLLLAVLSAFVRTQYEELMAGRLLKNINAKRNGEPNDISWAELLESRAEQVPEKTFLLYREESFSYRQMDHNANCLASYLKELGCGRGYGIGIYMRNSPRFLDIFFGVQKIGAYLVPINPELKGDGLSYLVNHSDINCIFIDAELQSSIDMVSADFEKVDHIVVNDIEKEAEPYDISEKYTRLSSAYLQPSDNPGIGYNREDICLIMYTSGTTGRPKGVVYRYKKTNVRLLSFIANVLLKEDDVYYTCLALCHGNALFVTTTLTLARRATMGLSRKFSANRFWGRVNQYNATVFNTIGSVIPILMKQPERPEDQKNNLRFVISSACPSDMWEAFENRFGTKIYEIYSAVDGGGNSIMNLGTAPVGSLGKPAGRNATRIVDDNGLDVPANTPGELLFKVKGGSGKVEYYKNNEASEKKSGNGWLSTGDIVRQDENGFIYFVGRNTESMRKGGENVSAYEVEHVILDHPAVEDVAVYAVPSEIAEDEIMAAVKLVDQQSLTAEDLRLFLKDKLAKYAVPRFIRFVDEFPKTNSHRIIKPILEKQGITEDTIDTLVAF
ncbi:MAG: AMP-binding protein [Thermodesulfobacteriota bacterium]